MDGEAAAGNPLEVVSSSPQHGLKRCQRGSSEGSDDDAGADGAARGAPRRAGIDAVEEEEEEELDQGVDAFVEEGVHAATSEVEALIGAYFGAMEPQEANADADAAQAQQLFDFFHFLEEVDGDDDGGGGGDVDLSLALGQRGWSTTGAAEVDTTLRLGLGGEQRDARVDDSLGAWLGAALQDGTVDVVGVYLPPGSDDYVYTTGPFHILPPVPEDSADFVAFFEADAAPADDASAEAPAAPVLDLNQPHAAPAAAAHEELFLFASNDDDDRPPEPCSFWPAFLADQAGVSNVPDMAPADDGRAPANTDERPTVTLDFESSAGTSYTAETSENRARRGVTEPVFAFSGEFL